MKLRVASLLCRTVLPVAGVVSLFLPVTAQPPPQPPPPQFPTIAMPAPMGMQRGTTLELNLNGTNLSEPTAVQTSIPGAKVTIPTEGNNGKDNARLKVILEVPKDAPIGFHTIRVATTRGPSNQRLFCVDDLPQVLADGKNRSKATAQALTIPCVVAGSLAAENADWFKITVAAGQRLSFDVLGRRLGSAIDPQISITDPRTGKEVAFNNDSPGLQTDPRLTYTFKEPGDYLVELRDVMHRGGGDFVYRLRIGDFPCATVPLPMAAKRGSKVAVNFAGPYVDGVAPVEVMVPADTGINTLWVAPKGPSGLLGWPVALAVSDLDEVVETEPNHDIAKAMRVPVPGAVTGRFVDKGDVDTYAMPLKKGRTIIEAHTFEHGSPTDVYMVVKDAKGAELAKTDPQKAPRLDFNAPADGDYFLVVEHLHLWFGPGEAYRVTMTPPEPGFDLNLTLDRYAAPSGSGAAIPLTLPVRRDYNGPIEVSVVGHPGITGSTTMRPPAAPPPPNQPAGLLFITAAPDVPPGLYNVKLQLKGTVNGKEVISYASVRTPVSQALANLPFPPRHLTGTLAVAVTEKPPFTLTAKFEAPETLRGGNATVTITAIRSDGFMEQIDLVPLGLPPGVVPAAKTIPPIAKGTNEIKTQFTVPANVPYGTYAISFNGKAKDKAKEFNVTAVPANLVVAPPFELTVDPVKLPVDVGAKAKLKVTAARKGGYQGPITLALRNLPANVTAAPATIAQGQDAVEMELTAAANAAVGDKADVDVQGTATAAANQTNQSAAFTLSVIKK